MGVPISLHIFQYLRLLDIKKLCDIIKEMQIKNTFEISLHTY